MIGGMKDRMASRMAQTFVNERIGRYGRVEMLTIDSGRGRIELVCALDGETSAIGVTIERYRIEEADGKTYLEVTASAATRPWLARVLADHLHGRRLEVPGWAAAILR